MSEVLHVRVDGLDRWRTAAQARGVKLADFVRESVEQAIGGPRTMARAVVDELLPELERMLESNNGPAPIVTAPVPFTPPRVPSAQSFDPQCEDVHLHRPGKLCLCCGGAQ